MCPDLLELKSDLDTIPLVELKRAYRAVLRRIVLDTEGMNSPMLKFFCEFAVCSVDIGDLSADTRAWKAKMVVASSVQAGSSMVLHHHSYHYHRQLSPCSKAYEIHVLV